MVLDTFLISDVKNQYKHKLTGIVQMLEKCGHRCRITLLNHGTRGNFPPLYVHPGYIYRDYHLIETFMYLVKEPGVQVLMVQVLSTLPHFCLSKHSPQEYAVILNLIYVCINGGLLFLDIFCLLCLFRMAAFGFDYLALKI